MPNKKSLFIKATGANPDTVTEISKNRFRTEVASDTGTIIEEYQVWTAEEAESFGYLPGKGEIATSDPTFKVYRII